MAPSPHGSLRCRDVDAGSLRSRFLFRFRPNARSISAIEAEQSPSSPSARRARRSRKCGRSSEPPEVRMGAARRHSTNTNVHKGGHASAPRRRERGLVERVAATHSSGARLLTPGCCASRRSPASEHGHHSPRVRSPGRLERGSQLKAMRRATPRSDGAPTRLGGWVRRAIASSIACAAVAG